MALEQSDAGGLGKLHPVPKTLAIVVNWNKWSVLDTMLKSLLASGPRAVDILCDRSGTREFALRRLAGCETHGSGCTLSAAIAAGLARGRSLAVSVEAAKKFLHRGITRQISWRRGKKRTGAVRHS